MDAREAFPEAQDHAFVPSPPELGEATRVESVLPSGEVVFPAGQGSPCRLCGNLEDAHGDGG